MKLTEELIKKALIDKEFNKEPINQKVAERYDWLKVLIDKILINNISIEDNNVKWGDENLTIDLTGAQYNIDTKERVPLLTYFGIEQERIKNYSGIDLTEEGWKQCVKKLAKRFRLNGQNLDQEKINFIIDIECMLGGHYKTTDDVLENDYQWRILSESQGKEESKQVTPPQLGVTPWVSSNFSDETYFFHTIDTIQKIKENKFDPKKSMMVLFHPHRSKLKELTNTTESDFYINAETKMRERLETRFPYKFFSMWTSDNVIKVIGLQPFLELVRHIDKDGKFTLDETSKNNSKAQELVNCEYQYFRDKWEKFSNSILDKAKQITKKTDLGFEELSKSLSLCLYRNNSKSSELTQLLSTGNHAVILWGPPGTGKTYSAENAVVSMLGLRSRENLKDVKFTQKKKYEGDSDDNSSYPNGAYSFVQFHPNYTYEDFIGGIVPELNGNSVSYKLKIGRFKAFCDAAKKHKDAAEKSQSIINPFIFIVDEINRADLSAVFGELLYCLEYRDKEIDIPNFNDFCIPSNVYIIGTMNNVDKSLVSFDLALRRRFGFVKLMPQLDVLNDILSNYNRNIKNINTFIQRCKDLNDSMSCVGQKGLKKNNNFINLGCGDDYQIGQAYFKKICDFLPNDNECTISPEELGYLWKYNLLPLIEEYVGGSIDDNETKNKIKDLEEAFIAELK